MCVCVCVCVCVREREREVMPRQTNGALVDHALKKMKKGGTNGRYTPVRGGFESDPLVSGLNP